MEQADARVAAFVIRACAVGLELHEGDEFRSAAVGVEIFFGVVEAAEIFARNVDAAAL